MHDQYFRFLIENLQYSFHIFGFRAQQRQIMKFPALPLVGYWGLVIC